MLTNADIVTSFDQLNAALKRAREALTHSEDLPPLDLAETLVATTKLGEKLSKLADRMQSLAAPSANNGAANGAERPRRRSR